MPAKVLLASRLREGEDPTAVAAATLAERIGGELVLVYVAGELATVPLLEATAGGDADGLRGRMRAGIERDATAFLHRNAPGRRAAIRVVEGDVVEQITRAAAAERADYLVIGTHGRNALSHLILGSTSQDILKRAPCPVLVVPTPGA